MAGTGELDDLDDIIQDFLQESAENLDELDRALVALEHEPDSRELLSGIFRIVHTVKGTCGFLPFPELLRLTHTGEELLVALRDGRLRVDADLTDLLLDLGDAIRAALREIETTGSEGSPDHDELVTRMERARDGVASAEHGEGLAAGDGNAGAVHAEDAPVITGATATGATTAEPRDAAAGGKVRVGVELLDSIMSLVGELVLTRNQLSQCAGEAGSAELRQITQRLQLITAGLQDGVMQARMQPIGNVWKQMPRVVRDLAVQLGKSVVLDTAGEDTELDRTLLEAIKDPLTHILRNAVDHGVETPEVRAAAGKPAVARVSLSAYHRGGLVHIEVADDGAGIDTDALRATAVARGLLTADEAVRLTEQQALHLVFHPGLSTAAEVSNLSGRGVGMDVVRTNIERIGGLVDIESRRGRGTVLRIKIPLTLAIVPAVVVRADGQRFALPQGYVRELVQLGKEGPGVEHTHRSPVYRLRGELLPLVDLRSQLRLPAAEGAGRRIVVLNAQGVGVGLVVDAILGTEEIVVKPLGAALRDLRVYAGAATMSDGGVALVLDVAEVARRAGIATEGEEEQGRTTSDAVVSPAVPADTGVPALLVDLLDGSRATVPLDVVRRLEQLPAVGFDLVGGSPVVGYRDGVLPLVGPGRHTTLSGSGAPPGAAGTVTVVVCHVEEVTVGLPVAGIVDTVLARPLSDADVVSTGPVAVDGRVVPVVDVDALLLQVDPSLMPHTTRAGAL